MYVKTFFIFKNHDSGYQSLIFYFWLCFLLTSVKNKRLEFEEDKTEIKYNNLDSA
jgi:hypothetical protein